MGIARQIRRRLVRLVRVLPGRLRAPRVSTPRSEQFGQRPKWQGDHVHDSRHNCVQYFFYPPHKVLPGNSYRGLSDAEYPFGWTSCTPTATDPAESCESSAHTSRRRTPHYGAKQPHQPEPSDPGACPVVVSAAGPGWTADRTDRSDETHRQGQVLVAGCPGTSTAWL